MWFSLFAAVLILAITFYQGLHGLFSSVISCILTILSAALAFGLYEDVYYRFLVDRQPDHGKAIALIGLFVITLLILRTIFDMAIKHNMQFHMYVDRGGGGVFGFITAMVIVGMMSIGFQMLPFGSSLLAFERYSMRDKDTNQAPPAPDSNLKPGERQINPMELKNLKPVANSTWLQADGFTVSLISTLSANALKGRNSFADLNPNFLSSLHWGRAHPAGKIRLTAPRDCLTVIGFWDVKPGEFFVRTPVDPKKPTDSKVKLVAAPPPDAGMKRWAVRVGIGENANDTSGLCFMPQQVRLVGRDRKNGPLKEYFLVGINEEVPAAGGKLVEVYPAEGLVRNPQGPKQHDFVFQVPEEFQAEFLEFKANARVEIPPRLDANKKRLAPLGPKPKAGAKPKPEPAPRPDSASPPTPPDATSPGAGTSIPRPGEPGQDRVSGAGPARDNFLNNQLPFTLTEYSGVDLEIKDGLVEGGRVFATLDDSWQPRQGGERPITGLMVPEGKRMLQLSVEKLQPQSWLGNIYGGMIDTIADFYLVDDAAKEYKPVGAYAMAVANNKKQFELVFLSDIAREAGRELPKFQRIKPRELQGQYGWYFLFHLPPGTKPVRLHTGRQQVDLRPLQIVVP